MSCNPTPFKRELLKLITPPLVTLKASITHHSKLKIRDLAYHVI
jgi:hypothetical protein